MLFWQILAYFGVPLKRISYCLKTILMVMKMIATVSADRLDYVWIWHLLWRSHLTESLVKALDKFVISSPDNTIIVFNV